jgi:hypothetical protein
MLLAPVILTKENTDFSPLMRGRKVGRQAETTAEPFSIAHHTKIGGVKSSSGYQQKPSRLKE